MITAGIDVGSSAVKVADVWAPLGVEDRQDLSTPRVVGCANTSKLTGADPHQTEYSARDPAASGFASGAQSQPRWCCRIDA